MDRISRRVRQSRILREHLENILAPSSGINNKYMKAEAPTVRALAHSAYWVGFRPVQVLTMRTMGILE
jgi:hypothetical protein